MRVPSILISLSKLDIFRPDYGWSRGKLQIQFLRQESLQQWLLRSWKGQNEDTLPHHHQSDTRSPPGESLKAWLLLSPAHPCSSQASSTHLTKAGADHPDAHLKAEIVNNELCGATRSGPGPDSSLTSPLGQGVHLRSAVYNMGARSLPS